MLTFRWRLLYALCAIFTIAVWACDAEENRVKQTTALAAPLTASQIATGFGKSAEVQALLVALVHRGYTIDWQSARIADSPIPYVYLVSLDATAPDEATSSVRIIASMGQDAQVTVATAIQGERAETWHWMVGDELRSVERTSVHFPKQLFAKWGDLLKLPHGAAKQLGNIQSQRAAQIGLHQAAQSSSCDTWWRRLAVQGLGCCTCTAAIGTCYEEDKLEHIGTLGSLMLHDLITMGKTGLTGPTVPETHENWDRLASTFVEAWKFSESWFEMDPPEATTLDVRTEWREILAAVDIQPVPAPRVQAVHERHPEIAEIWETADMSYESAPATQLAGVFGKSLDDAMTDFRKRIDRFGKAGYQMECQASCGYPTCVPQGFDACWPVKNLGIVDFDTLTREWRIEQAYILAPPLAKGCPKLSECKTVDTCPGGTGGGRWECVSPTVQAVTEAEAAECFPGT